VYIASKPGDTRSYGTNRSFFFFIIPALDISKQRAKTAHVSIPFVPMNTRHCTACSIASALIWERDFRRSFKALNAGFQ